MSSEILTVLIERIGRGNVEAAARAIGVRGQRLHSWRAGRVPCPDHWLVLMAELAGHDPEKVLGQYHFERFRKSAGGTAPGAKGSGIALAALLACLLTLPGPVTATALLTSRSGIEQLKHYWAALMRLIHVVTACRADPGPPRIARP